MVVHEDNSGCRSLPDGLVNWIEDHLYMGRPGIRHLEDEASDPACLVVWAMATKTQGFVSDEIGTADRESLGTQFLLQAVAASVRLWQIRFKLRDKEIRRLGATPSTLGTTP